MLRDKIRRKLREIAQPFLVLHPADAHTDRQILSLKIFIFIIVVGHLLTIAVLL